MVDLSKEAAIHLLTEKTTRLKASVIDIAKSLKSLEKLNPPQLPSKHRRSSSKRPSTTEILQGARKREEGNSYSEMHEFKEAHKTPITVMAAGKGDRGLIAHDYELKAVVEQNAILRVENRRLLDIESALRLDMGHLQLKSNETNSAANNSLRNRLLTSINDKIKWITERKSEFQGNEVLKSSFSVYEESYLRLKSIAANNVELTLNSLLTLVQKAEQSLSLSLNQAYKLCSNSDTIDKRIDLLRVESYAVGQDASKTIQKMKADHQDRASEFLAAKKGYKIHIASLQEKLKVALENVEAIRAETKELNSMVQRPDILAEVILMKESKSELGEHKLEDLRKENKDLHSHIKNMDVAVESWKAENMSMHKDLMTALKDKMFLESEAKTTEKALNDCKDLVEEEREKYRKSVEQIKSLGGKVKDARRRSIEDSNSQIKAIADVESKEEEHVNKFLKQVSHQKKTIESLKVQMQDCDIQTQKLVADNAKLNSKYCHLKDKHKIKEGTWVHKINCLKVDNQNLVVDHQGYSKQFATIQELMQEYVNSEDPIQFVTLFKNVHEKNRISSIRCQELEARLLATKEELWEESRNGKITQGQFDTLGDERLRSKGELVAIIHDKSVLEVKVATIQNNLDLEIIERRRVEEKLKLVMGRLVEFLRAD